MSSNNLPLGIIKMFPRDFIVQELIGDPSFPVSFFDDEALLHGSQTIIKGWDRSSFTIFNLLKSGWNTEDAVREVAGQLDVPFDGISYQGIKDRRALTSQRISVQGRFRPSFFHEDIVLMQLYGQGYPLKRGGHAGNRFDILVRSDVRSLDLSSVQLVPNFFGPQRLGRRSGSERIGRLLLEGKFKEAIDLILDHSASGNNLREARRLTGESGSWEEALFHPVFKFSFKFEIQKWQSYLWNELLLQRIANSTEVLPDRLEMWNQTGLVAEMYRHLWDTSSLTLDPRALNALAIQERQTIIRPSQFQAFRETDGWRFKFDLPPGAYATVVLSQLFQLEEGRPMRCSY